MKLKWRIATILMLLSCMIITIALWKPSFQREQSASLLRKSRSAENDIPCGNSCVIASTVSDTRHKVIDWFVRRYAVDWEYSLNASAWMVAERWINPRQIHPDVAPQLGAVLRELSNRKIIKADVGVKGTQLKLQLLLEGGQRAAFKPKWYDRDHIIRGTPYEGKDRHNGEIAAYHLQRILGYNRAPLVVGRVIDLEKEIIPVADKSLLQTFYTSDNNTCFYGKCLYCKGKDTGVCASGTKLEGSMILWLPSKLPITTKRHPWARTYRPNKKAKWEYKRDFCGTIQQYFKEAMALMMDFIDTAIADYIIGNADRHTFDTFSEFNFSMLILLDSAKSFGNPEKDELTILAPLYQCCRIRRQTFERLEVLRNGVLSEVMRRVMEKEPVAPVLSEPHYQAMDRRLSYVLETVEQCTQRYDRDDVIVHANT